MSNSAFELSRTELLAPKIPRQVMSASVRIGPVTVHGLIVYRCGNGHLRVFWPSYKDHTAFDSWRETVEISPDLREQIEAAVIAAYRDEKKLASKAESNPCLPDARCES